MAVQISHLPLFFASPAQTTILMANPPFYPFASVNIKHYYFPSFLLLPSLTPPTPHSSRLPPLYPPPPLFKITCTTPSPPPTPRIQAGFNQVLSHCLWRHKVVPSLLLKEGLKSHL